MKLLSTISLGLLATISLNAQTTMCFKENHTSMTTIESIPLDGGECTSTKSVKDMKNDGWKVDDIKIENLANGKNYIYIFKKESQTLSSLDEEKIEQRIMQKLETRKKTEKETRKKEIKVRMSKDGKKLYINKCQNCHGEKADKSAYATSRPLINLTYSDMQLSIRDYELGSYDRGNAFIMKPYAASMNQADIKNVYSYIQSLKPKKDDTNKEESK
ncbi:MAG: hypothetical protein C0625_16555 [Arcobacter sp.]|nr:MAG: hypothetical protein C0625_16555 [Arcobacter sp.]